MFNRVDDLLNEAEEAPLYIIEFGKAKNKGYEVFIGIEGDDQPYYNSIIKTRLSNKKIAFIRCGFRDNVLDFIEYLKKCDSKEYRESMFLGFVDNDYGEKFVPKYSDVTYVTPCYSYENFYTTVSAFQRFLESNFHVKEFDEYSEDFEAAISSYLQCRNQFFSQIKEVEAIVRTGYLMEKNGVKSFKKTHVSKLKLTQSTISVNGFEIGFTPTMQEWLDNIDDYIDSRIFNEVKAKYEPLNSEELNSFIRGKIVFDFYIRYIKELLKDEEDTDSICFKTRNKVKKFNELPENSQNKKLLLTVKLKPENLIDSTSTLAPYADVPQCLLEFLDRVFGTILPKSA